MKRALATIIGFDAVQPERRPLATDDASKQKNLMKERRVSDVAKRRRRWPWIVLAGVLLLFAGTLVWKRVSLNAAEQKLVGTWSGDRLGMELCFFADRRFEGTVMTVLPSTTGERREIHRMVLGASWTAIGDRIEITGPRAKIWGWPMPPLRWLVQNLLSPAKRESMTLRFESDDRIQVQGHEFIRLP